MGNACSRKSEVRTQSRAGSRRGSRVDENIGVGDPRKKYRLYRIGKKGDKSLRKKGGGSRRGSFTRRRRKGSRPTLGDEGNLSWRIRTFSESSVQSDDYYDAETSSFSSLEDSYVDSEDEGGSDSEYYVQRGDPSCSSYLSYWWDTWFYRPSNPYAQEPAQAGAVPAAERAPKVQWDTRMRSLTRVSRQNDDLKVPPGSTLDRAVVKYERCKERAIQCETQVWDEPELGIFNIRGKHYMKDRKKHPACDSPVYRILSVDYYRAEQRVNHIAQRLKLPNTDSIPPDCPITPLLVVNWQIPLYPAKIFGGAQNGEGLSVVCIFSLKENFDAASEIESGRLLPQTYELLKSFCQDGQDLSGLPMRERLKMIPHVSNLDEWCSSGCFGLTEQKLLRRFYRKPMMVKPQVEYYVGPEYIEVDINMHEYKLLTRKYFYAMRASLKHGIMDMSLVLEGRSEKELPEQILAAFRVQKVDFMAEYPPVPPLPTPTESAKAGATMGEQEGVLPASARASASQQSDLTTAVAAAV